jgi:hypothetical protein
MIEWRIVPGTSWSLYHEAGRVLKCNNWSLSLSFFS